MSSLIADTGLRTADAGVGPADERPLSDAERKIVTRLLSDPFSFPQSFKTWLISFLEGSDLSLPLGAVVGLSAMLGVSGGGSSGVFGILPAGLLFPYAADVAPDGTLLCQGQAISRTNYDRLFKAIGTKWGVGDGTTTFNIPDFRNRTIVGIGPGYALAASDGLIVTSRGPRHHHTLQNHTHAFAHYHLYTEVGSGGTEIAPWASGMAAGFHLIPNSTTTAAQFAGGAKGSTDGPSDNNTSGGGPLDAPSYACAGVIINY